MYFIVFSQSANGSMFARNYLFATYAQRLLTNETVGGITVVQIEV